MKKSEDYKYILFPLPLLQEIFKKPKNGFDIVFDVGIYKVADNITADTNNAIKQVLYCYYRMKEELTSSILSKLNTLVSNGIITLDEDYNGFNGDEFNPEEEIIALTEHLKDNPELYTEIIEFHKLRQAKAVLNMKFDIGSVIKTYRNFYNEYNGFTNSPLVSVKRDMMFEYYRKDKSEFQRNIFAMYAGIKSIIGNKEYACTTHEMITCRMFGAANNDKLLEILKDKKVKANYNKVANRYQFDKMLKYLLANNFLSSKIAYNRRTYLSCSLSYDDLKVKVVEHQENSLISRAKDHRENELQAINYIKHQLNK